MFFFVNGRAVREPAILHAYTEAYRNILPSGTFPVTILYVATRHRDIDVNVHPAKTEVRFRQRSVVHDAIRDAVLEALRSDKTIVPMGSDASLSSGYSAPRLSGRVPDSWGSGSIARDPVSDSLVALDYTDRRTLDLSFETTQATVGGMAFSEKLTPD